MLFLVALIALANSLQVCMDTAGMKIEMTMTGASCPTWEQMTATMPAEGMGTQGPCSGLDDACYTSGAALDSAAENMPAGCCVSMKMGKIMASMTCDQMQGSDSKQEVCGSGAGNAGNGGNNNGGNGGSIPTGCTNLLTVVTAEMMKGPENAVAKACEGDVIGCPCFEAVKTVYGTDDVQFAKDTTTCKGMPNIAEADQDKTMLALYNSCSETEAPVQQPETTQRVTKLTPEGKVDSGVFTFSAFVFGVFALLF